MEKIKIAYVIDTIESPTAGTEKQLILLIKNLNKNIFEPHLVCLYPSKWLLEEYDLSPLHFLDIHSFLKPASYWKILKFARFLRNNHFQIVQTHFRDANFAGIIAAKLAGVKAIISTRRNQGYWHNKKELLLLRFLNKMVTHIIANSQDTKRFTEKVENISPEKIKVIYNGLDMDLFSKNGETKPCEVVQALNIPRQAPLIGVVANLRPVKGIDVFIKAAAEVAQHFPEARFLIAGDGPEKEKLIELSQRLGLNGKVFFLGKINPIVPFLKMLNVGVLPSHSESLSNAVIEYMAMGLPVVCTETGGSKELIINGENGYVVPTGDSKQLAQAIEKILQNQEAAHEMGEHNKEKAYRLFSLKTFVKEYQEFYQSLVDSQ